MRERRIETERLIGAPLAAVHLGGLRLIHTDPRAMATLSADGKPIDESRTRGFIAREEEHWNRHGFGLWAFHDRANGEFVGYCGLRHATVEGINEIELAYAVRSEFWSKGFATEMASAALRDGSERMQLEHLVAFTLPSNTASRRTMEKLGFKYQRDIVHVGLPHVLYVLVSFNQVGFA